MSRAAERSERLCVAHPRAGRIGGALATVALLALAPSAGAEPPAPAPRTPAPPTPAPAAATSAAPPPTATPHADLSELAAGETRSPPPLHTPFLQYGVALTAEALLGAGKLCDVPTEPCVIGSGGGIAARLGKRTAGPWYFGGAYELSKQDSNKLYRLAILQQARGEARYYIDTGRDVEPYGMIGLGLAGYGNEWGVDTFGPLGSLSVGAEAQLTRRAVLGVALSYRGAYLKGFTDSGRTPREAGLVSFLGLDVILEARDPL